MRESAILLIALRNTAALEPVEPALEAMVCTAPGHGRLRDALVDALARGARCTPPPSPRRAGRGPGRRCSKVPQARAHPMARPGRDPAPSRWCCRRQSRVTRPCSATQLELAEARRDLAEAEDESWTARLRHVHHERQHADTEAVARAAEASDDAGEGVFQRMLDDGAWRRQRRKP